MKNVTAVETLLGKVEVLHATMISRGRGQYTISISIEFEGENKTINVHSTDSKMYDEYKDFIAEGGIGSYYLMVYAFNAIESEVNNYVNSL